jgi:D-alanyl-D-alanine carboxypeptidase
LAIISKMGQMTYAKDENKGFIPASTVELFATAAALLEPEPDCFHSTNVSLDGSVSEGGTIDDDAVISGCGDPSIASRCFLNRQRGLFLACPMPLPHTAS